MEMLLKLVVYVGSVWISNQFADSHWVVGPVFGAAVIVFGWKEVRAHLSRAAAYVATSTAIYAFVYHLSGLNWGDGSDLFEYFLGPFPVAVVAGSVLLPCAHAILLGRPRWAAWRAAGVLVCSFYLVTLLGYLNEEKGIGPDVSWLSVMIAVWQGAYLWMFFRKKI